MITGDSYIGSNRQHRLSDQVSANTDARDVETELFSDSELGGDVRFRGAVFRQRLHLDACPQWADGPRCLPLSLCRATGR